MTPTIRALAAITGTAALVITTVFMPEGWTPMVAGAGLFALGIGAAVFGGDSSAR